LPVAMITGGASWFSRETARLLLGEGWHVVLADVNETNLGEVAAALGGGAQLATQLLDVADLADVRRFVADLVAERGGIEALVNVAGGSNFLQRDRLPFHETTPDYWGLILRPNLYGTFHCCHAVLPHMIAAKKGAIVNLASGMGLRGAARMAPYSAAKAAIIAFTQAICQEVGPFGVRVNCIAPGSAESRWYPDVTRGGSRVPPLGERTSAEDVAHAIHFLISDNASHITGACLDVSGGTALH
jgi:NAD(P)-dependent dehydrogenase (short-subunit alcohol dehydrogenase family)